GTTTVQPRFVPEKGFVERWNGSQWTIHQLPRLRPGRYGLLLSISCPSARTCTTVGQYTKGGRDYWTLAERWSRGHWHVQHTPNPRGAIRSSLSAVSCPSSRVCTAIGAMRVQDSARTKSPLAEEYSSH
ncbi:MAG: hypothetical protein ACJ764_13005, partial [Solirubrobacteraceae bacterium]